MEFVDDGDSESEVLGPVQESHQILQDATSHNQISLQTFHHHTTEAEVATTLLWLHIFTYTSYDDIVVKSASWTYNT